MRFVIVTLLFSLAITSLPAQRSRLEVDSLSRWSVGLDAGVSKNYLITNISGLQYSKITPGEGNAVGIPVLFRLNSWLSLYTDPGIIQKNYEFQRTGEYTGVYTQNYNLYAQLPIMVRFNVRWKHFNFYLQGGGYSARWLSGRVRGSQLNILDPDVSSTTATGVNFYNFDERYQFNSLRDNRWEWGWIAGGGISYRVGLFQFFIEGRNTRGLTDLQKHYQTSQIPKHNATYGVSVGTMMNLTTIRTGIFKKQK